MAIPANMLHLRYGNVGLNNDSLVVGWEVYHPATSTIIESGSVAVNIAKPGDFPVAWLQALNLVDSAAASVYAKHEAVAAIDGFSLFDADLILDGWLSDAIAGTLVHPISGSFGDVSYSGIVELVNAILERVPGPPMWFWAESLAPGELRVKCIGVPGATVYYVFNGTELLGNVSGGGWQVLGVPDGAYSVRIAGVVGGVIGVCSFPVSVTVGVGEALGGGDLLMSSTTGGTPPSLVKRIALKITDPFGVLVPAV